MMEKFFDGEIKQSPLIFFRLKNNLKETAKKFLNITDKEGEIFENSIF